MPKNFNKENAITVLLIPNTEQSEELPRVTTAPVFVETEVWEPVRKALIGTDALPPILEEHYVDKSSVRTFFYLFGTSNVLPTTNPMTTFFQRIRDQDQSLIGRVSDPRILYDFVQSVDSIETKAFKDFNEILEERKERLNDCYV